MCTDASGGTSIQVFRRWLKKDGTEIEASEVVSEACFDDWRLGSSSQSSAGLSRTFQRELKVRITGSGGRQPFEPDEEESILKMIRKKEIWPAFRSTELTIGCRGFRVPGYHERQQTLNSSLTESLMAPQHFVARNAVDPTISKRNRQAKAKRGAAEMALPQNKEFKRVEMEYPSKPQQIWMHATSTLPASNIYGQPYDVIFQNKHAYSPLLGKQYQPLLVPNGYFNPLSFHLSRVPNEQAIAPGRLAFDNGQPHG